MKTVVIYHNSVPNAKNLEKIDLLNHFATGVAYHDSVINQRSYSYIESDVGIIQGWISADVTRPHLKLRNQVITEQLANRKHVVAVDSNLFLYANTTNPLHYLRYSFDGVFPATGNYCDTRVDPKRWLKISADLNLTLKDYRTTGKHILICMQRNGGWSMGGMDVQQWVIETIMELRKYTDRPIVIRPHPGDKATKVLLNSSNATNKLLTLTKETNAFHRVTISKNPDLKSDLINCWAVVNCNSSPVVGAAIEGYPIFVTDIKNSQCIEIANSSLSQIENPLLPDRQQWVERISMFHWNFDELKSGECWSHMRSFIDS